MHASETERKKEEESHPKVDPVNSLKERRVRMLKWHHHPKKVIHLYPPPNSPQQSPRGQLPSIGLLLACTT